MSVSLHTPQNWRRRCWVNSTNTWQKKNRSRTTLNASNSSLKRTNAIAVGKQKAVFLATCGASTYETLKNLCLPSEVKDVSFSEIIQTHYTPEPLLIYEHYIFGKRTRKHEEKVADFAVDLKRLSSTRKFDAFLDQALCMQFVVGLNMPKVQSRFMQERTLAFDEAVKIAIAESSAVASCANIDAMRGGGSTEDGTVHRVF